MTRYSVTPRLPNDFLYEYYQLGLEFGKVKVMSENDLQNDMIQGLIQRNALTIQPYIESKKEEPQSKKSNGKRALISTEPVNPLEIKEESN